MTMSDATAHRVTVEIPAKWVRMVRSPIYLISTALMGTSVTFAPLFLYWSAQGRFFPGSEWFMVPLCFGMIYLVPLFFFYLGQRLAEAIRQDGTANAAVHGR